MDLDVVFVAAVSKSQRRGHNVIFAVGADISVAASEDKCEEAPRMVVEEAFIVTAIPLVQPD